MRFDVTYTIHWKLGFVVPVDTKLPKAPRKLGRKRRYNNSTVPPLDFRTSHWASLFDHTEVQNDPRGFTAG